MIQFDGKNGQKVKIIVAIVILVIIGAMLISTVISAML